MSGDVAARDRLLADGLLADGGVLGSYHRSFAFERVARGVEQYVSAAGAGDGLRRQLHLAPVQARATLERSGYLGSFPDLIGVVSSYEGTEADAPRLLAALEAGEDWTNQLLTTDLALSSAACHGLYPLLADESLAAEGSRYELQTWCFRHEPSPDPARMQCFRQHEFVYVGSADGAVAHRDAWRQRGLSLLGALGLEVAEAPANDPFFGRAGRLLASNQRTKELKYELLAPITSDAPGAIASTNCHEDHFGVAFDLRLPDGSHAHTACVGFGLERVSLALHRRHGLDSSSWPTEVREHLGLSDGGRAL